MSDSKQQDDKQSEKKPDDKPIESKVEARVKDAPKNVKVDVSVALPQATVTERVTVARGRTVLITNAGDPLIGEPACMVEHKPGAILDLHPAEAARLREHGYLVERTGDTRIPDYKGPLTSTQSL